MSLWGLVGTVCTVGFLLHGCLALVLMWSGCSDNLLSRLPNETADVLHRVWLINSTEAQNPRTIDSKQLSFGTHGSLKLSPVCCS